MDKMKNKIMFALIFGIVLFSLANVSAVIKEYDATTKTVTFNSNILFIKTGEIGKAQLDTPLVYYVNAGYSKIAQVTLNYSKDYEGVFSNVDLYNLRVNSKKFDRPYDIKYLTYEEYKDKNGTIQQKEVWNDFKGNIKAGEQITLGIFMNVNYGEAIEWIPTITGEEIGEWAVVYVTDTYAVPTNSIADTGYAGGSFSPRYDLKVVNFTVDTTSTPCSNAYILHYNGTVIANVTISGGVATFPTKPALKANVIYYAVCNKLGASYTKRYETGNSYNQTLTNILITGGCNGATTFPTSSDVLANILTITTQTGSDAMNITLLSPPTLSIFGVKNINFSLSVLDPGLEGITNVSILLNGVVNQTNSSNLEGIYNFTINGIPEGYNNWSIEVYNGSNYKYTSDLWTFHVDTTDPIITINSPITEQVTFTLPANITLNATISDAHLSTCWYYTSENSTNKTYTCNALTYLNFSSGGDKTIYVFANDTTGHNGTAQTTFFLNSIQRNATYTTPALEGTSTILYFNLTASSISSFNGSLYWNGTRYNATATNNGTYGILTTGLNLPSISSNQNISLYWDYWLNGINYNSSTYYQIIYYLTPINVTSLSCVDKALRFDIQDEENLSALYANVNYNFRFGTPANNTYKTIYGSLTNVTTFYLCINATVSQNYTLGYGELDYGLSNYVQRKYYLWEGQTVSNNTLTNHSLKSLLSSDQTSFLLTLEDTSLNVYTEKYTALWRWYPNLNEYKVVDMGRTDENGQTVAHVNAEDTDYRVGLYETNGSLIKLGDPLRFLCTTTPCTFTLTTDAGVVDYTSIFGVEKSLTYNETTKVFTFIYNDPSQKTRNMTLLVTKETGTDSVIICNSTSEGYTGVISCNTSLYTGIKKAVAYRTASPAVVIAQKIVDEVNTAFRSPLGLFISIFIWLAIVFAGLANSPVWVVILGVIGLIPALISGAINLAVFTGIAVLAGIVLHFIKRALAK